MLRSIAAVILSYIAMSVLIVVVFSAMWFGLGPDRLLLPGEWKGGLFLTVAAPGITLLAGLFGGWMCAKVARTPRTRGPVVALAGIVLALGLMMAYSTLQKPEPTGPREPGMTVQQMMEKGREPAWVAISNPIIGAAAVLIGGLFPMLLRKGGANSAGARA